MKTRRLFSRFTSIVSESYWRLAVGGTFFCTGLALAFIASFSMPTPAKAVSAQAPGFYTQQIPLAGTGSPQTGEAPPSGENDFTQAEWPGQIDEPDGSPGPFPGIIVNRSLSRGTGRGVRAAVGKKAKSNPQLNFTFTGLNHYQQRYSRRGNQFSVEPPDQGMCAGNGYIVEAVNDVLNVFNTSGQSVLADNTATNIVSGFPRNVNHAVDLNSFFGYLPAINRTTGVRGPFVTDPSCLYDAATQRFFVVVLTLETTPGGAFTTVNHIDIAVSQTSDPTGSWNIYRVDVTNDGSNPDPSNACPCLGDYPHIGADANGFYVTTNAYPWFGNGFDGAQIYAFSKAQLAAGAPSVTMVHIDTFGLVNAPSDAGNTQPGFTVWPAQSPGTGSFNLNNGGTEFFLSSNAADEATHPVAGFGGNYTSDQIVLWTLTNTSSLNSSPALSLSNRLITVSQYGIPPKQVQPGSGTIADKNSTPDVAQGDCINDTSTVLFNGQVGCWRLLFGAQPAHNEVISRPDANDTRMQQVMYANGKVWGALDTAVSFDDDATHNRAGIAWYILNTNGNIVRQGTYGVQGASLTYPAIGVTASGRGVMAFSYTDDTNTNPSAAYAPIDAQVGVGDTHIIATSGATRDDGFSSYKAQVGSPPRTRWGDYGSAAVDGNSVWIASELTQTDPCNYIDWGGPFFLGGSGDNLLGTCGGASHGPGARTALADWNTRISKLTP
jgi:hypothetical protein